MLKKITKPVLFILFGILGTLPVYAQFEGKIIFKSKDVTGSPDGNNDTFTLYITPERILLQGENSYNVMGSIQSEGILIRLDHEDFVFLTGKDEALKISRQDISSMMNFFSNGDEYREEAANPEIEVEEMDRVEDFNGYTCKKFKITDREDPEGYIIAWMTKEIAVNWGMLADSFEEMAPGFIGGDYPFDLVLREGNFPVRIEVYENNELQEITEAEEISESGIARAMVRIPPGVKVLSFQDYLFQKMSQQ